MWSIQFHDASPVYCTVCSPPKVKSSSIITYLTPLSFATLQPPFLWGPSILVCVCEVLFLFVFLVYSFVAFSFISHVWVKSYGFQLFVWFGSTLKLHEPKFSIQIKEEWNMAAFSTALIKCHVDWVGIQEIGIGNKCVSLVHH